MENNNNTIEETSKRVFADTQAIRQTAAQAAAQLKADVVDHAAKAKVQVDQLKADVVDHAAAHVENAKAKAKDVYDSLREYAGDHPVGVLTTGLIVGFLLATSRRR